MNGITETKRRLADERGQGLVEYALILALVSLAAIVALGFLSGKINGLFSKAGNTLNTVQVASGPAGTAGAPANGTNSGNGTSGGSPVAASDGAWYTSGSLSKSNASMPDNPTGLFHESGGAGRADGATRTYTFANGYVFTCTWDSVNNSPNHYFAASNPALHYDHVCS